MSMAGRRACKLLTLLIVFSIIAPFSLARSHSSRRASASRASSRGRRSESRGSRVSRRGGRGYSTRGVYVSLKGRRGRSRWRRVVAVSSGHHTTGVHNFLAGSYADSMSDRIGSNTQVPTMTSVETPADPNRAAASPVAVPPSFARPAAGGVANPATAGVADAAAGAAAVPVNPLVGAYIDSLAARGFNPENQGFILETLDGEVLAEYNADRPFNPASVVKVVTSMVAISKLGPDFRFRTTIYTDGTLDPATGILHGSLYVMGCGDPSFFHENAMLVADQLNAHGIRTVEGNLVVQGPFYFNFSASREASARGLRTAMTPESWGSGESSAYQRFLAMRAADNGRPKMLFNDKIIAPQGAAPQSASPQSSAPQSTAPQSAVQPAAQTVAPTTSAVALPAPATAYRPSGPPSLKITGETITSSGVNSGNLKLLAVHTSLPLVRVLKGQNDFSNNWMAGVIGDLVGGPESVERFLEDTIHLKPEDVRIVTASGLGSNYISPRAMAQILGKLTSYLAKQHIGLEELLPVAGIDAGTLERRFTDAFRGSVVGKTGTLHSVSALAGLAFTRNKGPLLFVIFNHGGSPYSFRAAQDETIKKVITLFGGPSSVRYAPAQ
jgi:D-alanyl-D-alanine carboxypeptidase/D-alanyl-D-alanine-endopeptidase (penicillin-binding protein 4)